MFGDGGSDNSGAEAQFHFEEFFPTVFVGVDSPDPHASIAFPDDEAGRGRESDGGRGGEKAGGKIAHSSRVSGFECEEGLGLGRTSQGGREGRGGRVGGGGEGRGHVPPARSEYGGDPTSNSINAMFGVGSDGDRGIWRPNSKSPHVVGV